MRSLLLVFLPGEQESTLCNIFRPYINNRIISSLNPVSPPVLVIIEKTHQNSFAGRKKQGRVCERSGTEESVSEPECRGDEPSRPIFMSKNFGDIFFALHTEKGLTE